MNGNKPTKEETDARIIDDKELRAAIKAIEGRMRSSPIKSAERMLALRAVQTAKHWLGEDLAECGTLYPYPESVNPTNTVIHKPAP